MPSANLSSLPPTETPSEPYSDLGIFLDLVEELEHYREVPEAKSFLNLLKNKNKTAIAGSSVLARITGKLTIANDIDIFVDDRDDTTHKILDNFFDDDIISEVIWPAYENKILHDEDRRCFVRDSKLTQTNSSVYDFNIMNYSLDTFRVQLGNYIVLNFILLRNTILVSDNASENHLFKTKEPLYSFTGRVINNFINEQRQEIIEPVGNYSTYLFEYIEKRFDFQELKYVYDFDTKSFLNVYEAGLSVTQALVDKLVSVESHRFTDSSLLQLAESAKTLKKNSEHFKKNFSNSDVVTIAGLVDNRFKNLDSQNPRLDTTSLDFMEATSRIKKYRKKGFTVEDPEHILVNLHLQMAKAVIEASLDPDLEIIERQAIFNSHQYVKKKYQFLNKLKNIFKSHPDEIGMVLEPDSEIYNEVSF